MSVQELIEKLNSAKSVCEIECFDAEMAAIDHAIEAIKKLDRYASEADDVFRNWCTEDADEWIKSLGE